MRPPNPIREHGASAIGARRTLVEMLKATVCAVLGLFALVAWTPGSAEASSPVVVPIYFYPNDHVPDQRYIDQIAPQTANVKRWFKHQVRKTFTSGDTIIIRGDHDSGWYKCSPDECGWAAVWSNVLGELSNKGYPACQGHVIMVFVAAPISFSGGASCDDRYSGSPNGGIAMYAETIFDPTFGIPIPDCWWCTPDAMTGSIAHELGHAFSLPHPEECPVSWPSYCDETVMWAWWNYPNVGLLDLNVAPEKTTLTSSPFFENAPCHAKGKALGVGKDKGKEVC